MPQEEQVLVIERKVLEQVGMFNGLVFDVHAISTKSSPPAFHASYLGQKPKKTLPISSLFHT